MKLFLKLFSIVLAMLLFVLPFFGCNTVVDNNDPTDDVGEIPTSTPDAPEPTESSNTPEPPPTELLFNYTTYPLNIEQLDIGYRENDVLPQLEYATNLKYLTLEIDAAKVDIFNQLNPPATLNEINITVLSLAGENSIELDMSKFAVCKGLTGISINITEKVFISQLALPNTGFEYNSRVIVTKGAGLDLTGCDTLSTLTLDDHTNVTLGLGAKQISFYNVNDLSILKDASNIEEITLYSTKPEYGHAMDLSLLPDSIKRVVLNGEGFDISKLASTSVTSLNIDCPDITDLSALLGNDKIEHLAIRDKYIKDICALENIPSVKSMLVHVYPDYDTVPVEYMSLMLNIETEYTAENADLLGDVDYLNIPVAQLKAFASGEGRSLRLYVSPNP
ncbi:MAG: hypothetical protein IJA35_01940 [Clostridia bacterium]|nr:hypothetical protein [Clostridia bacterium]